MAKIREIIEQVDLQKPNAFPAEGKLRWIAQLDGKIAQNVMLMGVEELQQFDYRYPDALETEPLVGFPHDDLYALWLEAQIDARNGEWNRYQNTIELYNAAYGNYVEWFANTYRPAEGCGGHGWVSNPNVPQYYITAYGLAVKAGYTGDLYAWLDSLKGPKGDKGDPGAKLQIGKVETLPVGSKATASIGGTAQDPVLDIGIPEGFYRAKSKAGFIYPLALESAPEGFLLCDGSAVDRSLYIELFAAIGTTYGAGDGETTFNVPNLSARESDTGVNYAIATGKNTGADVMDIIQGVQVLPLAMEYGGTGATDPLNARRNLEIYPVGAIYLSVVDTDPGKLFGGTWERLKDCFLLGASDTYSAGSTGGEAKHTLTEEELPKHNHSFQTMYPKADGSQAEVMQRGAVDYNSHSWWELNSNNWTAGSGCENKPHNNMPPYLAVYMWKRVA